ncbi:MAG: UDP-N-acetylglucosamine 2-epimerase (non-hydrolyzing) [Clostridiales bacterium]|nr:UDP-N-acetylglucosamine 2-epimerase (non-hydrolyzing) [Clostridiales bacterium]
MSRLKLMTILGTRPEIIRLSAVMRCADRYFDHVIVHTGQNYDAELNEIFFRDLELRKPDYYLNAVGAGLGETMGRIISESYQALQREKPDAVLILGDTNSALSAISAKRLKIPIFHMEAGNRCWDWNVSEMINRKIVDHISDINLPYTEHSRRYLLAEGIDGKTIFVTGSPMREVLHHAMPQIDKSDVLERLSLTEGKYILVSAHREENIDIEENFISLMTAINHMAESYQVPVIYSTHPRSMKFIKERDFQFHPLVRNVKPLGFFDYNHLQMHSLVVLSDSGTLSEESAMLDFCGVLIRTSTERPEVLDKGTVIIGGITAQSVSQAAELAIAMRHAREPRAMPGDYGDLNVSVKVVKLIQSYMPIVNETVWLRHPRSGAEADS